MPHSVLEVEKTTSSQISNIREKAISLPFFAVLFALAILVYIATTGILPLVGRDEPRYVQIGREMLNSGDWITPRLGGFTWFEKPVLLYWMVAASFSIFGVSEWAARLGPALCGLGCGLSVWWAVRSMNEKWANWSGLALLSSGGMLAFAHGATFDIVLTFCVALALASWWKAQRATEWTNKLLALFWVGVGLAFLAKGLVAFVLTLGTVGLYALLRRERVKLGFWWGLPLALLVSLVWYGPMVWVNGEKFVNEFFVQHQFQRFTSDKYKHHQPFWYYLEILPILTLPWTPFLVGALWKLRQSNLREATEEQQLKTFALAWMIVPVAFFSISGSKLPGYILPALPGAAILIGAALNQWARSQKLERLAAALTTIILLGVVILTTTGPGIASAEKESMRSLFKTAHEKGLGHLRVVSFRTTSRGAQFYGAQTLVYDKAGEPLRLQTVAQLNHLTRDEPALALIEDKDRSILEKSEIKFQDVAHNGKTGLVLVSQ